MSECLFCDIARGDIPSTKVSENEEFFAFRDINPAAPTHVLVVPKAHVASLAAATDATMLGNMLLFAKEIAAAEGLENRGYRVVLNTNADAGQTVFHMHAHVLGGRLMRWPPG